MKIIINVIRIFVAVLFIFSGLVKAIDPVGLSFKMQEFFELWGTMWLNPYSLTLSIVVIAFEIIAGVALLLNWKMKLFSWLLLLLIIFFTFLTGYAYLSGKFKDCGCFGDCIPITPLTSFLKDVLLLVLILVLFKNRNKLRPFLSNPINVALIVVTVLFSFGLQFYVLKNLPLVDCLPYKKGNNIAEMRKIPADAVPDKFDIKYVYEKDGNQYEFALDKLPADIDSYKFVDQKKQLIEKGKNNVPKISGFVLQGISGTDSTDVVLNDSFAFMLYSEDISGDINKWQTLFGKIYTAAKEKNIPVYLITASPIETAKQKVAGTVFKDIQIFNCDRKAIQTAARTNPVLYLLAKATILNKWAAPDFINAEKNIRDIPAQPKAEVATPDPGSENTN